MKTFAVVIKKDKLMYSALILKEFLFGIKPKHFQLFLMQNFNIRNKIPYNLFEKLYKDTRRKVVSV